MLRKLLQQKNFPSPLIIEGSQHSSWIQEYASYVLCEKFEACGKCHSCRLRESQNHPDWLAAEGHLKIEELRDKLNELRHRPFQSPYRLLSFREFQEASTFVQNALLKTLEEPQSYWLIVLGTDASSKLLPTVRSRCLFFKTPHEGAIEEDESNRELFERLTAASDFQDFSALEALFKSREQSKQRWEDLLTMASQNSYPGFWQYLAPHLEEAYTQLDRNLHPKILWETAWARATHEAC